MRSGRMPLVVRPFGHVAYRSSKPCHFQLILVTTQDCRTRQGDISFREGVRERKREGGAVKRYPRWSWTSGTTQSRAVNYMWELRVKRQTPSAQEEEQEEQVRDSRWNLYLRRRRLSAKLSQVEGGESIFKIDPKKEKDNSLLLVSSSHLFIG